MQAEISHFVLIAAALCAVFLSLPTLLGSKSRAPLFVHLWKPALGITFAGLSFALIMLIWAFLTNDFSIAYVANNSNTKLDPVYKISAVWGSHEGSMLLWVWTITVWASLFAVFSRDDELFKSRVLGVLLGVTGLICLFLIFTSNPFERLLPLVPPEGKDLNPILQDIGMILHPPMLFLGYAGTALCFAFGLGALMEGKVRPESLRGLTTISVIAWLFLTSGNVLGSWWAYNELGWGGWWFWDPVENASLLPWLSASALLHSLYITRQRGIFRHWSLLLAIVTLILSLLGTLIVRSGILVSVHAFALDNVRAAPLFALFTVLSLASLGLYAWRGQQVRQNARFGGWSREMLILVALLLFSAVLLIVLIGTLYPMIYGLFGWGRLSVGAPYFNRATLPFGLLMLLVIVLAMVRSRKVSFRIQLPALLAHAGVLVFAAGIVFSSGSRQEISLNLSPGQQVELAGYIFRFERLDLEAKGNYTSEKAQITLWHNEKRIGSLQPERRFYAARRQQMMEPGIRWNLMHDWYAVMGEKTGPDRYAMRLYVQTGVRWIWGGGLLMVFGALLSGWRGRKRDA